MLFNSIPFAVFLPIVFVIYWFATNKERKSQNMVLLIASYIFYGWWDWRFLFLLVFLSLLNFFLGILIEKNEADEKGKIWLFTGLIINLGVLAVFKYYNFFIDGFIDLLSLLGYDLPGSATKIILPLGISFYIFLSLSYIIDISKKKLKANRNITEVLLTLSFFPIILAGPIQRPASLLPQISEKREFNYNQAIDGIKQILWGLFAKVVIADNLAFYVDGFFNDLYHYSGSTLLLGAVFYAVQIYADFSGYSNMAIGIAKLFGFSLMQNFAYPYFSRNISEFWKRWHISLVTWFRDYVFLPLSFALSWRIKGEKVISIRTDLFIYMIASAVVWFLTGLWHGSNYTFIVWGMIHGFLLIAYHFQKSPRKKLLKKMKIKNDHLVIKIFETTLTLLIILFAWIFFRADDIGQAVDYISKIISASILTKPDFVGMKQAFSIISLTVIFLFIEWLGKEDEYAVCRLGSTWRKPFRYALFYAILFAIFWFRSTGQQFIYLQF